MSRFIKGNNTPPPERPTLSPEKKRLIFTIAINGILLSLIYFGACYGITDPKLWLIPAIVSVGYWVAFAVFLLIYVIYNRAFTRKKLTVDMLPREWTREQKEEYIANGKRRLEKSQWMLSLIIPLLIPIALDALYLFTLPLIQNLFGITVS